MTSRAAALPAPGRSGRRRRGAAGRAGPLDRGRSRRLVVLAAATTARSGQPDPRRGGAAAGARRLPAHAARLAHAARPAAAGDPVHPDPPLHGGRRAAGRARAVPAADRRRAGVLAVRGLRRPRACAGGRPASRRRSSLVDRRDPRLARPERPARERGRASWCSSRSPSSSPSSWSPTSWRASIERGPKLDRMVRLLVGGGTLLAVLSLIEWRTGTNLFNGLQPRDPVPPLRGLRRPHRARHRLPGARLGAAPDRARRRARDADPAHRLPPPPRRPPVWLVCGGDADARSARLRLAHGGDHADRAAGHLPVDQARGDAAPGADADPAGDRHPDRHARHARDVPGDPAAELRRSTSSRRTWARAAAASPTSARASPSGRATRSSGRASAPASCRPTSGRGIGSGGTAWPRRSRSWTTSGSATLLEIGAVGALGLLWLFCRAVRRLAAARALGPRADGWLIPPWRPSLAAYAVGMLTFDAFAFIQVTFLAFIMLGFTAVATARGAPVE